MIADEIFCVVAIKSRRTEKGLCFIAKRESTGESDAFACTLFYFRFVLLAMAALGEIERRRQRRENRIRKKARHKNRA